MQYSLHRDLITDKVTATNIGPGCYPNCHGYGRTEQEAITSLKMEIIRRKRRDKGILDSSSAYGKGFADASMRRVYDPHYNYNREQRDLYKEGYDDARRSRI